MRTVTSELTGEPVDTSSDAWRHECECRWLLDNKTTRAAKHQYLYGVWDREQIMVWNPREGRHELAPDWRERVDKGKRPLFAIRGLEAADRILADARRLWEARQ